MKTLAFQKNKFDLRNTLRKTSALWPILFLVIGAFCGIVVLKSPLFAILLLMALPTLYILLRRPEIIVLTLVVLISSIVYEEALPKLSVVGGSLHVTDIFLLALLALIPFRLLTDTKFKLAKTPIDIPLSLFYVSVIISAIISLLYYHLDFHIVTGKIRSLSYYLAFFCVTNLVREKKQITFMIKGLFVIAVFVAVAMLLQAGLGDTVQILPGRVEKAATFGETFEATRIIPPGELLVYTIFITTVSVLVTYKESRTLLASRYFLALLTLGCGILVTYTRSYWVATILSCGLLGIIVSTKMKLRLIYVVAMVCIIGLCVVMFFGYEEGKISKHVRAYSARFGSLFSGKKMLHSETLDWRYKENEYAIKSIKNHPLFGIGIGNNYRPELFGPKDKLMWYVHNGFLFILVKTGLVGFLFFMWFYLGFIIRGLAGWKKMGTGLLGAVVVGFSLSGVGILIINVIKPAFVEWNNIVLFSVVIGLCEAMLRLNRREDVVGEKAMSIGRGIGECGW